MFVEGLYEMKGIVFAYVLYGEVVDRENECDGAKVMFLQAWRCGCFVVAVVVEALM